MNPNSNSAAKSFAARSASTQTPNLASPNVSADQILPDDVLPMRLKSVARLVDVSEKTVRRWIQKGLLRSHKLGGSRVVRKRDLRTFLDQQAGETNKDLS